MSLKSSGSPEIEEHLSNFVDDAKEQAGSMGKDFFRQLLGDIGKPSGNGVTEQLPPYTKDASPSPYDAPPQYDAPHGAPPSYEASQAQAKKTTENLGAIEQVLFQLVGFNKNKNSESAPQNSVEVRPGIDYHKEYFDSITNFEKKAENRVQYELNQKIKEITDELIKLIATTRELKNHFGTVAVEPPPPKAGKYHETFFEWLLIMIKQARQKVENSDAWLGAVKGKKKKGYWDKAKDHGTTFTQSGERSTVTSTG